MKKFIKENWFKLSIILILGLALIFGMIFYFKYNRISVSELYKINSDCSKEADLYIKSKGDDSVSWNIVQSYFNIQKGSCIAEFTRRNLPTKFDYFIIDLTHSKELSFHPTYSTGDDIEMYKTYSNSYKKIQNEYFKQ